MSSIVTISSGDFHCDICDDICNVPFWGDWEIGQHSTCSDYLSDSGCLLHVCRLEIYDWTRTKTILLFVDTIFFGNCLLHVRTLIWIYDMIAMKTSRLNHNEEMVNMFLLIPAFLGPLVSLHSHSQDLSTFWNIWETLGRMLIRNIVHSSSVSTLCEFLISFFLLSEYLI